MPTNEKPIIPASTDGESILSAIPLRRLYKNSVTKELAIKLNLPLKLTRKLLVACDWVVMDVIEVSQQLDFANLAVGPELLMELMRRKE
jgi:hypothetical protein